MSGSGQHASFRPLHLAQLVEGGLLIDSDVMGGSGNWRIWLHWGAFPFPEPECHVEVLTCGMGPSNCRRTLARIEIYISRSYAAPGCVVFVKNLELSSDSRTAALSSLAW